MSKKCKGCGVLLQQDDKNAIGYTPKISGDYCQRCFRITHYDDVVMYFKDAEYVTEYEDVFIRKGEIQSD